MKLKFVKINPVENMTVFVLDYLEKENYIEVAKKLMDYSSIYAEQVGFVENFELEEDRSCKYKVHMMGGEFCGNATRSLGAYLVHIGDESVKKSDDKYYVTVGTSGLDKMVTCIVKKLSENTYSSKIDMPLPLAKPQKILLEGGYKLHRVDFSGITHFIVDIRDVSDKKTLFDTVKSLMKKEDYDAFGIMYYNFETCYMEPLVYVKATDSLHWERSCASGASALGVVLSYKFEESVFLDVHQMGGVLSIATEFDGRNMRGIVLDGMVEIVAEGFVNV